MSPHRACRRTRFSLAAALLLTVLVPAGARAHAQAERDNDDPFSEGSVGKALELLEAWDVEGAEAIAQQLQRANPDDPGTQYLLGRVAFENGEYVRAAEHYEKAFGARAKDSEDYKLATAAENETKGAVVEESAHFSFRYKPGKDAALVPYAMETLEATHEAMVKDLGYTPPARKVRVEFYDSPKALARVSSLTEEAIKTTGTIALCKYNRLMVTSPRALLRGYDWQDTLAHEFVHFVVTHESRNTVPIWLHEGLAKFLEVRWRGPAQATTDAGAELLLARALKKNALISFERMHPSIALLPSQEDAALAFAEVFTAIEFLHRRGGPAALEAIIRSLRSGSSDREAVAAAFGAPFDRFEAAWKASLRTRPPPPQGAHMETLVFKDEKKREPKKEGKKSWERGDLGTLSNPQARRHAHLGELLRARNRLAAAAIEYERAVKLEGPEQPVLARKYAISMMATGRDADAERVLRKSLAAWPEEATNHLLLGSVLVRTGKAAEAREHLLYANRRDPFDPEIHAALHAAGKALGDAGLTTREARVLSILAGDRTTWQAAAPKGGAAQPVGWLRIESPSGARVFVDGVDTGLTTPVEEHPLPPGKHVVKLVPESGAPVERIVVVAPDALVPFEQS